MFARRLMLTAVAVASMPVLLQAQIVVPDGPESGGVIYPPRRPPIHPRPPIRPIPRPDFSSYKIRSVDVQTQIHDQVAKVRMAQVFQNTGSTTVEASFLFPIPQDAAVSELTLLYDGKELPGKLLSREDARRIYEEIVRRQRDPALLEYMGCGLYQTSVFPIPPNADRTVEIRYSQLLRKNGGAVDFQLPLGTFKHTNHAIEAFHVDLKLETTEPVKTIYSPTHSIDIERPDDRHATCKLTLNNVTAPGDLRVLYGTQQGAVGMNLVSYRPSEKEDGFFMLLASPDVKATQTKSVAKTALIVVDRSGSMSGTKIEQAREAVKFFLHQLKPSDTFNVIAYDSEVQAFRPELEKATPESINAALSFADGINAGGGTNINGALTTALSMLVDQKRPSYVLFLTDGVPTVGEQNELKIVAAAKEADKVHARIFTLGIGYDVNSRLLDRLSHELEGQSEYVRPNENIETHVSALAKTIGSPLLTNIDVKFEFDSPTPPGNAAPISRTYPRQLTDLFVGQQLVWVGRYRKAGSAKVTLSGQLDGATQTFTLATKLDEHSVGDANNFVEKVWATRRIGEIIDQIDLHGQNKELTDELVQLSLKHGILTPYTSFLADEHVDVADRGFAKQEAVQQLGKLKQDSGQSGFAQRAVKGEYKRAEQPIMTLGSMSLRGSQSSAPVPRSGGFGGGFGGMAQDQKDNKATDNSHSVMNVGDKTFYWKNSRWQDADVTADSEKNAVRIKQFSDEYFELARRDHGKYAKYLAVEAPALIVLDGKTYLIEAATK